MKTVFRVIFNGRKAALRAILAFWVTTLLLPACLLLNSGPSNPTFRASAQDDNALEDGQLNTPFEDMPRDSPTDSSDSEADPTADVDDLTLDAPVDLTVDRAELPTDVLDEMPSPDMDGGDWPTDTETTDMPDDSEEGSCDDEDDCPVDQYCGPLGFCRMGLDGDDCHIPDNCIEDHLRCTDAACIDGFCGQLLQDGFCLIDGACVGEGVVNPGAPCVECQTGRDRFAWTPDFTNDCDGLPRSSGRCDGSECVVDTCDSFWGNCDLSDVTGCEAHLLTDPDNCGECGEECGEGTVCNVDECAGSCPGEVDPCNDACPDFTSDPNNCGGCGVEYACSYANAEANCVDSECQMGSCHFAYIDANADPEDGCEWPHPAGCVTIWVDTFNDTGTEDGSEDFGFTTIASALAVAAQCDTIQIKSGVYNETVAVVIDTDYLTFRGMSEVFIDGNGSTPETVTATGSWIVIENLTVDVGETGILLSSCDHCVVENVTVQNVTGNTGDAADAATLTGDGGDFGAGVHVENSTSFALTGNTITSITGGSGGTGGAMGSGGTGGIGAGIHLSNSSGTVEENTIDTIAGGSGGDGGSMGSGGTGGVGAGVYLTSSTGTFFSNNQISSIGGGDGGDHGENGSDGANQVGFGFYVDNTSEENTIERSNTVDGDEVVYSWGQTDVVIEGVVLNAASNPTNFGKMAVFFGTNIVIRNNQISHYTGGSGDTGGYNHSGQTGSHGSGIFVAESSCTIENNTISLIRGGLGGTSGYQASDGGGTGGEGVGIDLYCNDCTLVENIISEMTGGLGGAGGYQSTGGQGGLGIGIGLIGSPNTLVERNHISQIEGGEGGEGEFQGYGGVGGLGAGIHLLDSSNNSFEGNIISQIEGGLGGWGENGTGAQGSAVGLRMEPDSQTNEIANNTIWSIVGANGSAAIYLSEGTVSAQVRNTIISHVVGGPCLKNASTIPENLSYGYNLLHDCGEPQALGAFSEGGDIHDDPLFRDAPTDFHLTCDALSCSPAVDTGDTESECSAEPALNGCRINMGAFGNTETAAAYSEGVDDCRPVCPAD